MIPTHAYIYTALQETFPEETIAEGIKRTFRNLKYTISRDTAVNAVRNHCERINAEKPKDIPTIHITYEDVALEKQIEAEAKARQAEVDAFYATQPATEMSSEERTREIRECRERNQELVRQRVNEEMELRRQLEEYHIRLETLREEFRRIAFQCFTLSVEIGEMLPESNIIEMDTCKAIAGKSA